jgi:hypothetical protein
MTTHTSWSRKKELYELWKQSGLSKTAFARQQAINENNFYNWCAILERLKNKQQQPIKTQSKFIEVHPVANSSRMLIINTPSGYSIEIP